MGNRSLLTVLLCLVLNFADANSAEKTSNFISQFKSMAIMEMQVSGIPASIILAQCIHESSWGESPLAINANNYFGIKCKSEWQGGNYFHEDDDYDANGDLISSCFRVYDSVEASFSDHSDFLLTRERYQNLFALDMYDYKGWAKGLQKSGYATDKKYARKIISTIEKYALFQYDRNNITSNIVYNIENVETNSEQIKIKETEYITILGIRIKDLYDLDWAK